MPSTEARLLLLRRCYYDDVDVFDFLFLGGTGFFEVFLFVDDDLLSYDFLFVATSSLASSAASSGLTGAFDYGSSILA